MSNPAIPPLPTAKHAASGLTRHQSAVLAKLAEGRAPLSAYRLLDLLRDEGFRAPLQVYRALDRLTSLGLVHRLESLNAFVACAHPHRHLDDGRMAFAICDECGQVNEFEDPAVRERLNVWAAGRSFSVKETTIELRGTCAACSTQGG